jgi:hypothetical protein
MRENRLSGSEGGGDDSIASPYPYRTTRHEYPIHRSWFLEQVVCQEGRVDASSATPGEPGRGAWQP